MISSKDDGIVVVEVGEADVMVQGLQVTISGAALSERIAERIRTHESKAALLEERLSKRAGDLPFDIRASDGLETFGELQAAHELHRDRAAQLSVLRDGLKGDETYVLSMADLQAADLAQRLSSDDGNRRTLTSSSIAR